MAMPALQSIREYGRERAQKTQKNEQGNPSDLRPRGFIRSPAAIHSGFFALFAFFRGQLLFVRGHLLRGRVALSRSPRLC
jgi:hypothetical protein